MPATVLPCTDQKFTSRLFAPVAPSLERLRLQGRCPLGLKSPRSSRSRAYDCAGKLITGHYRSRGAGCGDLCGYNGGLGRRTGAEEDVGRTDTHTRMASRNSRLSLEPVHAPFHPSTSRLDTRNSIVSAPLKLTRARDIPDASVRRTPPSCVRGSKPLTARRLPPPPRHTSRPYPHRSSTTPANDRFMGTGRARISNPGSFRSGQGSPTLARMSRRVFRTVALVVSFFLQPGGQGSMREASPAALPGTCPISQELRCDERRGILGFASLGERGRGSLTANAASHACPLWCPKPSLGAYLVLPAAEPQRRPRRRKSRSLLARPSAVRQLALGPMVSEALKTAHWAGGST